jgi:hypothetical protein
MPCNHSGCKVSQPIFGLPGTKIGLYCTKHKKPGMINVKDKTCLKCNKIPNFGIEGAKTGIYCVDHKEPHMINVKKDSCLKCGKYSSFGIPGTKKGLYCSDHKEPEMINVKDKSCLKCEKRPSYGSQGSKNPVYCRDHKEPDMVNVVSKTCLKCDKRPNYANRGSRKALYCVTHKEPDMIDVKNKSCIKCEKTPTYGHPGTKSAICCTDHKDPGMVNVKDKTCSKILRENPEGDVSSFKKCEKIPIYGIPGAKKGIYCFDHKEVGMINVKDKTCKMCHKFPVYGIPGTKKGLYCVDHKEAGMVNVKGKFCTHDGCSTTATFGLLFHPKIHCARHRGNNEYYKNAPKCSGEKCQEKPCFTNKKDNYPVRCEDHKLADDVDVVQRKCGLCKRDFILKDGNLCGDCGIFKNEKYMKRKELEVKALLDDEKIQYQTWDKIPDDSCLKYRPDFVLDYGTHIVVLEVDENGHSTYTCECEQTRMINIHQDFGGLRVCFIRYNPDSYKNSDGEKIKTTTGRSERLLTTLKNLETHPPDEDLSVIYMYYNGDDGKNYIEKIDVKNLHQST